MVDLLYRGGGAAADIRLLADHRVDLDTVLTPRLAGRSFSSDCAKDKRKFWKRMDALPLRYRIIINDPGQHGLGCYETIENGSEELLGELENRWRLDISRAAAAQDRLIKAGGDFRNFAKSHDLSLMEAAQAAAKKAEEKLRKWREEPVRVVADMERGSIFPPTAERPSDTWAMIPMSPEERMERIMMNMMEKEFRSALYGDMVAPEHEHEYESERAPSYESLKDKLEYTVGGRRLPARWTTHQPNSLSPLPDLSADPRDATFRYQLSSYYGRFVRPLLAVGTTLGAIADHEAKIEPPAVTPHNPKKNW